MPHPDSSTAEEETVGSSTPITNSLSLTPEPTPLSSSTGHRNVTRRELQKPSQIKINKLFETTLLQPRRNKLDARVEFHRTNLNSIRNPKGFFKLNIIADITKFLNNSSEQVRLYVPEHIGNRASHLEARNVCMADTFDVTYLKCNQAYLLDLVEEELASTFSTKTDFLLILKIIMVHLDLLVNILRRDVGLNTVKCRNCEPGNHSRIAIYVQMRYNEAYRATKAHVEAINHHIPYRRTNFHVNALFSTTKELFKSFILAFNLDKGMV